MNVIAAVVVAGVVFFVARLVVVPIGISRIERRVQAHVQDWPTQREPAPAANRVRRVLDDAERTLSRRGWWNGVVLRLDRAGVDRRPIDILALVASLTVVVATGAAA